MSARAPASRTLFLALTVFAAALTAAHLALEPFGDQVRRATLLFRLVDLNGEANLSSWFSTMLWATAAVLAWRIGLREQAAGARCGGMWFGLALLFGFLSADEAAQIHEVMGGFLSGRIEGEGAFSYVWVYYGLGFVAAAALVFGRFWLGLPPGLRFRLAVAAVVFLSGAIGVEMIEAAVEAPGSDVFPLGATWPQAVALEEGLEMLGAILLVAALARTLETPAPE